MPQASAARRVIPLLDRVLVQRLVAPTKSIGGVILPDSSNTRLNEVCVVVCRVWSLTVLSSSA
jgi:chaperonin GroES